MASVKPLVITNGQVQRIQAGDTIDPTFLPAVQTAEIQALTNNNAGSIVIGTPVYSDSTGTVDKAQGDNVATSKVTGLVYDASIATSVSGNIMTDGVLTATTGQWDAVTGGSGGLTAGSEYYLDAATAGMLTTTAPSADGDVVAPVGVAISTTKLRIGIKTTVLL